MLSVFASCFFLRLSVAFSKVRAEDIFCGNCWQKIFECELLLLARWRLDLVLGGKRHCFLGPKPTKKIHFVLGYVFQKFAPKIFISDIVGEIFRVRTFVWERFLGCVWWFLVSFCRH